MATTNKTTWTTLNYPGRLCNGNSTTKLIGLAYKTEYKNSVDSPSLKAKRENPFTGYLLYGNQPALNLSFPCKNGSGLWSQYISTASGIDMKTFFPFGHLSFAEDPAYYQAVNGFYDKCSNLTLNMAQAFAERQQTIDLISGTAKRLAGAYRSLRRGRNPFTGVSCNGKDASKLWLEYTYGWTPLVSDVYSAIDLIKGDVPPLTVKASRTGSFTKVKPDFTSSTYMQGQSATVYHTDNICRGSSRTTVKAKFSIKDPGVLTANAIGLTNPSLLAWELLPYSFVVDWFLPIGSWLERQNALLGLNVLSASTTRTTVKTWTGNTRVRVQTDSYSYVNSSDEKRQESRYKSRVTSLPQLDLPRFKNPLSASHAITALALLKTTFGK